MTPAPAAPAAPAVSIPDLVAAAAPCISGAGRLDVTIHLHRMCMRVAACRLGLDLGSDHGHHQAYTLANAMLTVVQEHLLDREYPSPPVGGEFALLADWLVGRSVVEVRAEVADAADWWRSLRSPGRVL